MRASIAPSAARTAAAPTNTARAPRTSSCACRSGTVISTEDGERLADLATDGARFLVAKGGKGGLGNLHFKSSTNRAPRQFTKGEEGEQRKLKLELKVLADVGLLGMPNAGKSTLIRAISAARPKVADYPFTTLAPNLGVVRTSEARSFVVADIPGLIEGAAEGAGLGHRFLRHLARTRLLLHLVDLAPLDTESDPVHDARAIVKELKLYDEALYDKPRWLVLNKLDLIPEEERAARVAQFVKSYRWKGPVFAITAINGEGCRELIFKIQDWLDANRVVGREAGRGRRRGHDAGRLHARAGQDAPAAHAARGRMSAVDNAQAPGRQGRVEPRHQRRARAWTTRRSRAGPRKSRR